MAQLRYIAAGFLHDAEHLLNKFAEENSTQFSVFATKWKEQNFSWIFVGRRTEEELVQFTNEVFQLTLEFFQSSSIILQIGSVYLLYSLFCTQRSNPQVRIRITATQNNTLRKLQSVAETKCYTHLLYILDFLYKNAFDFVGHSSLYGPFCSMGNIEMDKPLFHATILMKDCKHEMKSIQESKLLEEIQAACSSYEQLSKKILRPKTDKRSIDLRLTECIEDLDNLLNDRPLKKKPNSNVIDEGLGLRRAQLKTGQFRKRALFRQLNPSDSEEDKVPQIKQGDEEVSEQCKLKRRKKKRIPKEKRRVGRPRKNPLPDASEEEESDVDSQLKTFKKRGPIQRQNYQRQYKLKVPTFNKKIFKDFLPDPIYETSEEDIPEMKEEEPSNDAPEFSSPCLSDQFCKEEPGSD